MKSRQDKRNLFTFLRIITIMLEYTLGAYGCPAKYNRPQSQPGTKRHLAKHLLISVSDLHSKQIKEKRWSIFDRDQPSFIYISRYIRWVDIFKILLHSCFSVLFASVNVKMLSCGKPFPIQDCSENSILFDTKTILSPIDSLSQHNDKSCFGIEPSIKKHSKLIKPWLF